jgi:uncharacterized protein affecting Mg2+/Co2+ transport
VQLPTPNQLDGRDRENEMTPLKVWTSCCSFGLKSSHVYTYHCPETNVEIRLIPFHASKVKRVFTAVDQDDSAETTVFKHPKAQAITEQGTGYHAWSFKITITNHSDSSLTLVQHCRNLLFQDGSVYKVIVGGATAVGDRGPTTLCPLQPSCQYSRFITMPTERGWMGGHLLFMTDTGATVKVVMPTMALLPAAT